MQQVVSPELLLADQVSFHHKADVTVVTLHKLLQRPLIAETHDTCHRWRLTVLTYKHMLHVLGSTC